jgi:hypothetical protein
MTRQRGERVNCKYEVGYKSLKPSLPKLLQVPITALTEILYLLQNYKTLSALNTLIMSANTNCPGLSETLLHRMHGKKNEWNTRKTCLHDIMLN